MCRLYRSGCTGSELKDHELKSAGLGYYRSDEEGIYIVSALRPLASCFAESGN